MVSVPIRTTPIIRYFSLLTVPARCRLRSAAIMAGRSFLRAP
jgi:hypothetical protein